MGCKEERQISLLTRHQKKVLTINLQPPTTTSSTSSEASKRRIVNSADLLRRGATLLSEACPRCGGVQIRFRGRVYCINEDDLSEILSSGTEGTTPAADIRSSGSPTTTSTTMPSRATAPSRVGGETPVQKQSQLRKMLEEKLRVASKQLESTQDLDQQEKLLGLISKYIDTLEKLK